MSKLIIFDFDGTMFHTGPGIHKAVNETLKEMNHRELGYDEVSACIGQGLYYLLEALDSDFDKTPETLEQMGEIFRKHYETYFREHSEPYDGLLPFLKEWPYEIAIASNKWEYYIKEILKTEPWNEFKWTAVIGGDTLPTKKPDPAPIQAILKKSKCKVQDTVIVGDGEPDVLVAQETGIKSIAVSYGYGDIQELMDLGADARIDNLRDLPDALIKVFS